MIKVEIIEVHVGQFLLCRQVTENKGFTIDSLKAKHMNSY